MREGGRVKGSIPVISIICLFESYQRISQLARTVIASPHLVPAPHPAKALFCCQEEDCQAGAGQPAGHQSGRECGQRGVLLPGQRPRQGRPHPPRQRQR